MSFPFGAKARPIFRGFCCYFHKSVHPGNFDIDTEKDEVYHIDIKKDDGLEHAFPLYTILNMASFWISIRFDEIEEQRSKRFM